MLNEHFNSAVTGGLKPVIHSKIATISISDVA